MLEREKRACGDSELSGLGNACGIVHGERKSGVKTGLGRKMISILDVWNLEYL